MNFKLNLSYIIVQIYRYGPFVFFYVPVFTSKDSVTLTWKTARSEMIFKVSGVNKEATWVSLNSEYMAKFYLAAYYGFVRKIQLSFIVRD